MNTSHFRTGSIGIRNREKRVIAKRAVQGCIVTRLEEATVLALLLLFFYREEKFDLLADRVAYKVIYKNLGIKEFELRCENKSPLYLRLDVEENVDPYTTDWDITIQSLKWNPSRTFYFDGHSVIADLKALPLIYRFELTEKYTEKAKYHNTLHFPFTDEYFPTQNKIEKLSFTLDSNFGVSLDLYD